MEPTTIAAIATPAGKGGIGIIKISGPAARQRVAEIFCPGPYEKRKKPVPVNDPTFFSPWKIYYGHIADPDQCRVYDEVIVAIMPAPKSYTREDVVEIQAHGGDVILESILSLLFRKGICAAQPGEFTRRAFVNGRIDLSQAEAVIDLINARCEAAVNIAFDQAAGSLSASIEALRSRITGILATIDAMVDFPEAVEGDMDATRLSEEIARDLLGPVSALVSAYEENKTLREGVRVVIAGAPNVGKSSIMNRLAGSDRAIVTEHPGTTRDYIETVLPSGGIPITLVDTAGLRMDPDPVEKIGIEKAHSHIQNSDIVLHVLDASAPVPHDELAFFEGIRSKTLFIVANKMDLANGAAPALPGAMAKASVVETSAKYNRGMELLKSRIVETAKSLLSRVPERPVPNYRHKALLLDAQESLEQAMANLDQDNGSSELVSIDLRQAYDRLGEITGSTAPPDVLDDIFSRYCIGK